MTKEDMAYMTYNGDVWAAIAEVVQRLTKLEEQAREERMPSK